MLSLTATNIFDPGECNRIIELALQQEPQTGRTEDGERTGRRSLVRLVPPEEGRWIYERVWKLMVDANQRYHFELRALEPLQITEYQGTNLGTYPWHSDLGVTPPLNLRKLSATVQLSRGDAYAGGDLEILYGGGAEAAVREQGAGVVFPAFAMHRVTPVTSGTRYSVVGWARGRRPFR